MVGGGQITAKFVRVNCECHGGDGYHFVDLFDPKWNDRKLGFYTCDSCNSPLVVRGDDGRFYFVGDEIK